MKKKSVSSKTRAGARTGVQWHEDAEHRPLLLGMKVLDELKVLARLARPHHR